MGASIAPGACSRRRGRGDINGGRWTESRLIHAIPAQVSLFLGPPFRSNPPENLASEFKFQDFPEDFAEDLDENRMSDGMWTRREAKPSRIDLTLHSEMRMSDGMGTDKRAKPLKKRRWSLKKPNNSTLTAGREPSETETERLPPSVSVQRLFRLFRPHRPTNTRSSDCRPTEIRTAADCLCVCGTTIRARQSG